MAILGDALVKFDYDKSQDDELTLRVGEVVADVVRADEGWYEGTLNGVRGMFPDNFVEIQPKVAPVVEPPKSKQKTRRAKVAFSYVAENEDELTLNPGEYIEILGEDEEGWFRGRVNGREGVFPNNFVQELEDNPTPPTSAAPPTTTAPPTEELPPTKGRPPSMIAMPGLGGFNPIELKNKLKHTPTPGHGSDPIPRAVPEKAPPPTPPTNVAPPTSAATSYKKAQVMFSYDATQADEVSVAKGEVVDVIDDEHTDDGWWVVRVCDTTRQGLVPDNYLQLMATPPVTKPRAIDGPPDNPPLPPKSAAPPTKAPPPGARAVLPMPTVKSATDLQPPPVSKPPLPQDVPEEQPRNRIDSMGVPPTEVLESKTKDRPKKISRTASKGNTSEVSDGTAGTPTKAPWQEELNKRKTLKPSVTPPPSNATPTPTPAPTPAAKPPGMKPKPARAKPVPTPTPKPVPTAKDTPPVKESTPVEKEAPLNNTEPLEKVTKPAPVAAVSGDALAWKAAFEQLEAKFTSFQKEMREEMQVLTEDLDRERKKVAEMSVDIDRLKRSREFRENLK